jgi:hypothetical protein
MMARRGRRSAATAGNEHFFKFRLVIAVTRHWQNTGESRQTAMDNGELLERAMDTGESRGSRRETAAIISWCESHESRRLNEHWWVE